MAARSAAVIGLLALGAGCAVAPAPSATASVPGLVDARWQVAEYVGKPVTGRP